VEKRTVTDGWDEMDKLSLPKPASFTCSVVDVRYYYLEPSRRAGYKLIH